MSLGIYMLDIHHLRDDKRSRNAACGPRMASFLGRSMSTVHFTLFVFVVLLFCCNAE